MRCQPCWSRMHLVFRLKSSDRWCPELRWSHTKVVRQDRQKDGLTHLCFVSLRSRRAQTVPFCQADRAWIAGRGLSVALAMFLCQNFANWSSSGAFGSDPSGQPICPSFGLRYVGAISHR